MDNARLDKLYRNTMLVMGILTAVLFILSLIALVEFPAGFKGLAIGMIISATLFLVLRSVHNYRNTFRVKAENKAKKKG